MKSIIINKLQVPLSPSALTLLMREHPIIPELGRDDLYAAGWSAPVYPDAGFCQPVIGDWCCIELTIREKKVKQSLIQAELERRVAGIEARDNSRLSKQEKNGIRETIFGEQAPHLLPETRTILAMFNGQYLIVQGSTRAKQSVLTNMLRKTQNTLNIVPAKTSPLLAMDVAELGLGGYAKVNAKVDDQPANMQFKAADLTEVQQVLREADIQEIGLNYQDQLGFILTKDGVMKGIQHFGFLRSKDEYESADDERMDYLRLLALELDKLLPLVVMNHE